MPKTSIEATFPFHHLDYAWALPHLGEPVVAESLGFPVLRRRVPGRPCVDGILPSPYVDPTPEEVGELAGALPELVSIVGVIRPGSGRHWSGVAGVSRAKEHYLFDPARPLQLSRRARRHLATGRVRWRFELADGPRVAAEVAVMHARVAEFRGFAGSSVDFPAVHFEQVAHAPWGVFFSVVGHSGELGAAACGALWGDELHLLHLVVSPGGLRSAASYVLMEGLTDWCLATRRRMFLGSNPRTGTRGLAQFKARWTNERPPSRIIRIVGRPTDYRSLARFPDSAEGFFPAYRAPG